jgi:hypothetical protein
MQLNLQKIKGTIPFCPPSFCILSFHVLTNLPLSANVQINRNNKNQNWPANILTNYRHPKHNLLTFKLKALTLAGDKMTFDEMTQCQMKYRYR